MTAFRLTVPDSDFNLLRRPARFRRFLASLHHARAQQPMTRFTPEVKHHILTQYTANVLGSGFKALATRYAIKGGHSVIRRWHEKWDGTPASLEPRKSPGRPRVLTHRQVTQHILNPIRRANRAHTAIHYPQIRRQLIAATDKSPSLQTVRRYGHKIKVRHMHTSKRTIKESQYTCLQRGTCVY
jgi:transposase